MNKKWKHKYLIDRGVELFKFCFTIGLLCFLVIKAPNEAAQIVTVAGAFVLGGTDAIKKLGIGNQ